MLSTSLFERGRRKTFPLVWQWSQGLFIMTRLRSSSLRSLGISKGEEVRVQIFPVQFWDKLFLKSGDRMSGSLIRLQFSNLPLSLLLFCFLETIKLFLALLSVYKDPQIALYLIRKGKTCRLKKQLSWSVKTQHNTLFCVSISLCIFTCPLCMDAQVRHKVCKEKAFSGLSPPRFTLTIYLFLLFWANECVAI